MKLKHEIDYKGLEKFLKSLNYKEDIETNHNKPKHLKLIEGNTRYEIEYFKTDISQLKAESIIEYGDPFLVDALGNDLSIVISSKRLYRLPDDSRSINAKFVTIIIDDCRAIFGTPLNGYWKIPNQFIKKLPKI